MAGDFWGIQHFLYDLKHFEESERKGFAKRLRGRSFGVRMFTEQIALHIKKNLDLSIAYRILSAGGRMYLLLPNNPHVQEFLVNCESEITRWSLNRSHGQLRFNLSWTTLSNEQLMSFSEHIDRVNLLLEKAGNQPLKSCLALSEWSADNFLCEQVIPEKPKTTGDPFREVDKKWGESLLRADGVALELSINADAPFPFAKLKFLNDGVSSSPDTTLQISFTGSSNRYPSRNMRGFVARNVPLDDYRQLLTFNEIATRAEGRDALGFIKADVDNLGLIFSQGLKRNTQNINRPSLSHIATLSRMLEGFYGGYIQDLCKRLFPNIYLVYSGGDDIAAVGGWNDAVEFILMLRKEFNRFVCHNPSWGLSAGIYIGNGHTWR